MSTAFVTGATGFVGGPILDALVGAGREVHALVRSPEAAARLESRGAKPVVANLLDPDELAAAFTGADTVFHVAGVNGNCLPDPTEMYRINIHGSRTVVRAAAAAGVGRVVYTSSAAVLGEETGTVGHESSPHRGWFLSDYERSKYEAELSVWQEADEKGVEVVAVNPSSVQGPGRVGGTGRLFLAFLNRKLRVAVDTRVSIVDVDDCTRGHLLAEERGRPGERYVLSSPAVALDEMIERLGHLTGIPGSVRMLRPRSARVAGAVIGGGFRVINRQAPLCGEMVRTLLHGHVYDGSKATREIGLEYTPLDATLQKTVAWYVEHGYVKRSLPGLE